MLTDLLRSPKVCSLESGLVARAQIACSRLGLRSVCEVMKADLIVESPSGDLLVVAEFKRVIPLYRHGASNAGRNAQSQVRRYAEQIQGAVPGAEVVPVVVFGETTLGFVRSAMPCGVWADGQDLYYSMQGFIDFLGALR